MAAFCGLESYQTFSLGPPVSYVVSIVITFHPRLMFEVRPRCHQYLPTHESPISLFKANVRELIHLYVREKLGMRWIQKPHMETYTGGRSAVFANLAFCDFDCGVAFFPEHAEVR